MLVVLLASCGDWPAPAPIVTPDRAASTASATRTPVRRGGRVTIGLMQEPDTLNPAFGLSPAVAVVTRPIVEGLIDFDAEGRPQPWLAEEVPTRANGGVSPDGTVVTFKLRQGVAWDDGRPFTAADVVFTFDTLQNPANPFTPAFSAAIANLRAVDALDSYTVRLTYERPDTAYLQAFPAIFPAHLFNGLTGLAGHPYNRGPIGTGPFQFREWAPGDHLTLTRNRSYRDGTRPYLDEIVFRFFTSDAAATDALRAGQIDVLLDTATAAMNATAGLRTVRWAANGVTVLVLNVRGDPAPVLADRAVRQALDLALDRRGLAASLPAGQWRPAASPLGGDDRPVPAADLVAARRLLDRAGWQPGPDGTRQRAGQPLTLTLLLPSDEPVARLLLEPLRAQLAALGVVVQVREAPTSTLYAPDGPARAGQFDLLLHTSQPGPQPLPALRAAFGCYRPAIPGRREAPGPANYGGWCDPAAWQWLDQAASAPGEAERLAAEQQLLDLVAAEAPVIPLVVTPGELLHRDGLRGLKPYRWAPVTWNTQDWWRAR